MRLSNLSPALAALAALLLCACGRENAKTPVWQGYVEADYVYVASPLGGQLDALLVKRGDLAKEGDKLFKLDSREEAAELAAADALKTQAEATLEDLRKGKRPDEIAAMEEVSRQAKAAKELSEIEFERESRLLKANATPVKEYDSANYALMANKARLAETAANLAVAKLGSREDQISAWESYCQALKANCAAVQWKLSQKTQAAPKSGRVFDTFHREGEFVAAASPVVALLPPGNVKIRFFVGERESASLETGTRVLYSSDGGEKPRKATIDYISPQMEYTPPVIYSKSTRSKLVRMVEARPEPEDAAKLNVGTPLDVELAKEPGK